MSRIVTLSEQDVQKLQSILMDHDGAQALKFLKERIHGQLEASSRKALDTRRGRP